jgi:methyl-accepting chemotaxis protein
MSDKTEELAAEMIKLATATAEQSERTNSALEKLDHGLTAFAHLAKTIDGLTGALVKNADMVKESQRRSVERQRLAMRQFREEIEGRGIPVPLPEEPEDPRPEGESGGR